MSKVLLFGKTQINLVFLSLIRTFAPMKEIKIKNSALVKAAEEGMDAFLQVFIDAINEGIGGVLNNEAMAELNSEQITLLGYSILRDEVMDGGFIQLIHNGYGPFFFHNPFRKALFVLHIFGVGSVLQQPLV